MFRPKSARRIDWQWPSIRLMRKCQWYPGVPLSGTYVALSKSVAALVVNKLHWAIQLHCIYVRQIQRILWLFDISSISHHSLGLSHSEATRLSNFLHFSKPKNLKKKSILEMADLNPTIDFLDVVSDDIPKGRSTMSGLKWYNLFQTLCLTPKSSFLKFVFM